MITAYVLSVIFVALAYLIGSIPFAYVVVYAVKRVDIRTVGSGNVGATNAGRYLGFKYFVLVFVLDLAKGLVPTLGLPRAVEALAGPAPPGLAVFVAIATILGHNFPVFLQFRGGKGVATSLGALFALDPFASAMTFASFLVFLLVTRYVSLSSLGGGMIFLVVHFFRVPDPWSRDQVVMSLATIGLLGMLIVRHRKNIARIAAGTEPKVSFRKRKTPPASMILVPLVVAVIGSGTGVAYFATRPSVLNCGAFVMEVSCTARTRHQRIERVTFGDRGRLVAVTCPRYNRAVFYRVDDRDELALVRDIELRGRPVDVKSSRDSIYVLQRPAHDARHFEEAWWERFGFDGKPRGPRFRVGYDPDEMCLAHDDRIGLVLLSGRAEGEPNDATPSLRVFDLSETGSPRQVGEVLFRETGDDPYRLAYDETTRTAVVSLRGTNALVSIDLSDFAGPKLTARAQRPEVPLPGWVGFDHAHRLVAADEQTGRLWSMERLNGAAHALPGGEEVIGAAFYEPGAPTEALAERWLMALDRKSSSLELVTLAGQRNGGSLPLRGAGNLGKITPMDFALAGNHVAVADKAGAVHLVTITPKVRERRGKDAQ